jgi:hypothetical protein
MDALLLLGTLQTQAWDPRSLVAGTGCHLITVAEEPLEDGGKNGDYRYTCNLGGLDMSVCVGGGRVLPGLPWVDCSLYNGTPTSINIPT